MRKYNYDKLPSSTAIRLVHLAAGGPKAPLRCNIVTTSLDAGSVYEAVSYVWGDEQDKEPIQVGKNRQLFITKNLAAALLLFQNPSSVRTLWIDSISIAQGNDEEKSTQVPLMGKIFGQASRVLVWLGEGPGSESMAMANECIERFDDAYEKMYPIPDAEFIFKQLPRDTPEACNLLGITLFRFDCIHMFLNLPDLDSPEYQAFVELFRSPWFFRAWTWQEQFVAKETLFHCGEMRWDATTLVRTCITVMALREYTGLHQEYGDQCYNALTMVQGRVHGGTETRDFSQMLGFRRGANCKYPHDLVYSLIGGSWNCPDVEVDYNQPFETLFTRTTLGKLCLSRATCQCCAGVNEIDETRISLHGLQTGGLR